MNLKLKSLSVLVLLAVACGGPGEQTASRPQLSISTASQGGGGGGGGGGGTPTPTPTPTPAPIPSPVPTPTPVFPAPGCARLPPSPTVDGAAWCFNDVSAIGPLTPNIDFSALANQQPGGIGPGQTRTASELVFNLSKKTTLTITRVLLVGPAAADYSIPAADLAALAVPLPSNRVAAALFHVTFSPTAAGIRTAAVQLSSNAGTVQVALTGIGLPAEPILTSIPPLSFIPTSAPDNLTIVNVGGETLALNQISIGGANPEAFALFVTNRGLSNCFNGILLAPLARCELAVGPVAGAAAPSSATLSFLTNDPVTPQTDVPLTLSP